MKPTIPSVRTMKSTGLGSNLKGFSGRRARPAAGVAAYDDRPMPDAVIIDAVRTPMGRYRGALAGVRPDDLAAFAIGAAVERTGIDPAEIVDVYLGPANPAGEDHRGVARRAG